MERTHHSLITDGVHDHEQTLEAIKPFWVFFVTNTSIGTWLVGVLLAGMRLDFVEAVFVLLVGGIIGSALPAATAVLGPLTRLSQLEAGRFALGRDGNKFPAFMNWVNAIGMDVINNILSGVALVAFMATFDLHMPFWLALALLVGIQALIGIYGHHLIQESSQYTGALLGLFFIVIGIIALHQTDVAPPPVNHASTKDILSALFLLVAFNISYATYTADYTRYLPKNTPSHRVFIPVFAGLFLSLFVFGLFGYLTAATVTQATPEGVMQALQGLTGSFSPLVLFLVAFNSIPSNALNDNSAAYCLMSAGITLSRPISACIGAVLGYIVCLMASNDFIDFFTNFLFLFAHGIAPWAAIILLHWLLIGKRQSQTPSGVTRGCMIFVGVTIASVWLFSANTLYTGLLSDAVGGVDVGPYIGFVLAGLLYGASLKFWPAPQTMSWQNPWKRRA